jgi:hypothetical protein
MPAAMRSGCTARSCSASSDLDAELEVPSEVALAELRREMASLAADENLDVTLEAKR